MFKSVTVFLLIVQVLLSQDFQVEVHRPYQIPVLPDSMTYDEFQIINRDLGWKELFGTIVFPGYASKYVKEDSMATYIMLGRYTGLALVGGVLVEVLFNSDFTGISFNDISDRSSLHAGLFITGSCLNVALTIFDWGWANLALKEKQDSILYKYRQPFIITGETVPRKEDIKEFLIPEK